MPLLSFEGVEVDIPTTLKGIQFAFTNGSLTIHCSNFSGNILLAKPPPAKLPTSDSLSLSDFPLAKSPASSDDGLVIQSSSTDSLAASSSTTSSKKRSIPDEQDEPELESDVSDESDVLRKRLRPTFLNDVEQTMLLAQLESSQSQSLTQLSAEVVVDTTQQQPAAVASPEKEEPAATQAADHKTPPKAKPSSVNQLKSFFSPDPKEPIAKKDSKQPADKKAARPPTKSKPTDATQTSIRDMMLFSTTTTMTTTPLPKAPTPTTQTARVATWSTVETSGPLPAERWGHTATRISDNRLVVYGGGDDNEATLGDLHVFDCKSRAWSKPLNCESIPRAWHDAVFLPAKNLLLVFGGERVLPDNQLDVLSDIMVLDTEVFLWYPPAVTGVAPTPRSGHACTVVGDEVVVYGGSRGRSRQSAVHVLDTHTWHWKQVKVEGKPPAARTYHSAVAVGGDSVVYFGGNDAKKSFDSVHVLTKCKDKADTWVWFHPCVVGTGPRARTGHSATLVDDSKLLIVGGWDPQTETATRTELFDDAFVLDTVTWEWERVDVQGLPARVGHCAVADDAGDVLLFGGQDANDRRLTTVHALTLQASD